MNNNAKVTVGRIQNIYGKEVNYVIIEQEKEKIIINIGVKNANRLMKMKIPLQGQYKIQNK